MLWERTLSRFALVALATTAFANSVELKESRRVEDAAEVFEVSAGTLEELAEELFLDFRCLSKANPSKSTLAEHELLQIPLHCCGTTCNGPVCCKRSGCNGQKNSAAAQITISSTISCIITNTASPTSTPSTLATTIVTVTGQSSATGSSGSVITTTNASGSGSQVSSSSSPTPTSDVSSSSVETLTDSKGSSIIVTLPSGSSITGIQTITTDGSTLTVAPLSKSTPSGSHLETLTESDGSTIIVTLPSGSSITGVETLTTDGSTLTVAPLSKSTPPGSHLETLTESDGSTITLALPSGSSITGVETLTTDGSTLVVGPAPTNSVTSAAPSTPASSSNSLVSGSVTSTMTTLPAGLSIQPFTETPLTGNSWLTTTDSSSSTTIVPIILPCPTCQPEIIWHLPEIPGVDFVWPKFPQLPTFHLPCIKIFGVHIAGSCPNPSGPTPVNDDPPVSPEPTSPEPTSSPSSSQSSSSSESACALSVPKTNGVTTQQTITLAPSTSSSIVSLSNLPTLSTGISTPVGSSCVSTALETSCAPGPNPSETACVTPTVCASWVATTTSASPSATPTGQVYVSIFTDSGCTNVLDHIQMNEIGDCYSPTDTDGNPTSFACFSITHVSTAAEDLASLIAYKGGGCFSENDSGDHIYPDLNAILGEDQKPFTMESLSLDAASS